MVLPAQNIPISSINSELPIPNEPNVESVSKSKEEIIDLFTQTENNQKPSPEIEVQNPEAGKQSIASKVVDLSTKKVKDISIETPDKITSLADDEEYEFRKGVDEAAHEQHS